jgi:hypothetical protein
MITTIDCLDKLINGTGKVVLNIDGASDTTKRGDGHAYHEFDERNGYLYNLNEKLNRLSKYLERNPRAGDHRISDDPVRRRRACRPDKLSASPYLENVGTADGWLTEVEETVCETERYYWGCIRKRRSRIYGYLGDDDLRTLHRDRRAERRGFVDANASYGGSYLLFDGYITPDLQGKLPYTVDSNGALL